MKNNKEQVQNNKVNLHKANDNAKIPVEKLSDKLKHQETVCDKIKNTLNNK